MAGDSSKPRIICDNRMLIAEDVDSRLFDVVGSCDADEIGGWIQWQRLRLKSSATEWKVESVDCREQG